MHVRRRFTVVMLVVAILLVALAYVGGSYVRAVSFVVRSAGLQHQHPWISGLRTQTVTEADASVPTRHGPVRGRIYTPAHPDSRPVLLVPGVNALAIDEPRLTNFASQIAASGITVVTVESPDLKRYLVTARSTDMIEDAARWVSEQPRLSRNGRVGVMGISFAGSLAAVAAGRPSIRGRVSFVFAFGGYSDFARVLRFLCTGLEAPPPGFAPDMLRRDEKLVGGSIYRPPHDYGVAVLLLALADRVVPAGQAEPLSRAILTYLHASHLALYDKVKSDEAFKEARQLASSLSEPAATLMREVNDREVARLGARLLPLVADVATDPALSPDRSPAPKAPVYLLHGIDDNVIPAQESVHLQAYLRGKTEVHLLLSELISHAELDRAPTPMEVWRLVQFWADMFGEL
jgi:dienelactone hydrolase